MTTLKFLETYCSATLFQLSSFAKIVPQRNLQCTKGHGCRQRGRGA